MPQLSREWVYFSLLNGVPAALAAVLFFLTSRFEKRFAWNVSPRQSGIFFGASFLLRAGLFAHIILASTWGDIRWLVWGNTVYAAVLLAVTMIWGDMLKWRRPIAIIWLFLYIEEPIWMVSLVPEARAAWAGMAPLPGGDMNLLLQIVLWVEAAIMLVAGIYAWAVTLARAESWGEANSGVLLNVIWLGALLASVVVFRSRFDLSRRPTRIYTGVIAALFVLLGLAYVIQG